jgi:hypothetical protein
MEQPSAPWSRRAPTGAGRATAAPSIMPAAPPNRPAAIAEPASAEADVVEPAKSMLISCGALAGCKMVVMDPSGDVALQERNLIIASTAFACHVAQSFEKQHRGEEG